MESAKRMDAGMIRKSSFIKWNPGYSMDQKGQLFGSWNVPTSITILAWLLVNGKGNNLSFSFLLSSLAVNT